MRNLEKKIITSQDTLQIDTVQNTRRTYFINVYSLILIPFYIRFSDKV